MSSEDFELNFNPKPERICKLCKKRESRHRALDAACPFGRGSFPSFKKDQFFVARKTRNVKDKNETK